MEKKRTIGITIFGILGIIWGILSTFGIATALVKYYSTMSKFPSDFGFPLGKSIVLPLSFLLAFGIISLVAGIGILKLRPWGHQCFVAIGSLLIFLTALNFLVYGFFLGKYRILINIILGGIILWFFNRNKIRAAFALSEAHFKKEKRGHFAVIIIAVLAGLGYFYLIKFYLTPSTPLLFAKPQRVNYEVKDKEYLLYDYKKRQLLSYGIYLPSDFRLRSFSYDDNFNRVDMVIVNPDKTSFLLYTNKPLFEMMLPIGKVLGIDSSYEFGKRFIHEKVSIIFLILKKVSMSTLGKFYEVYFGDWKGFLQKETRKDKEVYDYAIWHKDTKKSFGLTFIIRGGVLSEDKIKDIISSATLDFSQKTAEQHFQEGFSLFNQNKYEEAKFSFVNAIYQNRQSPQYNYYLGRAFFETEDWSAARMHLKKAIALQSNYTEAQRLLDEVESKEKTKK